MPFSFLRRVLTLADQPAQNKITVVSGLPRSGTSMMMMMLEAGGLPVLTDQVRTADESNPNGYYEYEDVKRMKEGHTAWVEKARGKAVKIISSLLEYLPPPYEYQVVFMQRNMDEILASQRKMLMQRGEPIDRIEDRQLADLYQKHLVKINHWLEQQPNMRVIYLNYNDIVVDPQPQVSRLIQFLSPTLDRDRMMTIVETSLYRHRGARLELPFQDQAPGQNPNFKGSK